MPNKTVVEKPDQMPRFTPAPEELKIIFEKAMLSAPLAEKRKMFGYPCAFVNGQMFAGLFQSSMFIRLSTEDRAKLLELDGARKFEPMPGRPMREYIVIPESMLNEESEMDAWLTRAFEYAVSLPAKTPKAKTSKKARL
jgi:TfoX/Sxy family transcriptional regulator of competence genes